jgi:lipopolysaccharide biosynthesis protein
MTVAFYLPQFHPIKENNEWWGNGFTEWTNVGKAKKIFSDHYQPRIPKDLGYYDLRLKESRIAQAEMAQKFGLGGFNYWHYWFGSGKTLLEKPLSEVVKNDSEITLPFALAWANHSWTGIWNNDPNRKLLEQLYPGKEDVINHFNYCLNIFRDYRYIRHENKLLFTIYRPLDVENIEEFIEIWRELAIKHDLGNFYFVGVSNDPVLEYDQIISKGFDAVNTFNLKEATNNVSVSRKYINGISRKIFGGNLKLSVYEYEKVMRSFNGELDMKENVVPTMFPNWDTSPRSGKQALILHNSTPDYFERHLIDLKNIVDRKNNKLVFLKSWNEWAEGNYMEPDLRFGHEYLKRFNKYFGGTN